MQEQGLPQGKPSAPGLDRSNPKALRNDQFRQRTHQLPPSLHAVPFSSENEKQSFDCFLSCASVTTTQFATPGFWEGLVLPAAHFEPAVKHLIFALGALHRR